MKPIIYQVFTRLFGNRSTARVANGSYADNGCGKLNDFDLKTLRRIKALGATHIWFTGVIRHASETDYSAYGIPCQNPLVVKGRAGSPYAITDYYDIDPDLAVDVPNRMKEFEGLVKRCHKAGLKVVIDFVPNHVARQYQSVAKPKGITDLGEGDDTTMHFSTKNNFYYCWGQPLDLSDIKAARPDGEQLDYQEQPARATGNDQFSARPGRNDWYETVKLNYGIDYCDAGGRSEHFSPIPDTWNKMTSILLFWAAKGIDAFRCDMAEMVPAAFWHWATDKVKYKYPDLLFIGEVYNPAEYRNYLAAGFDYLYDKVGMYDTVRDVICGRQSTHAITGAWQQTDDIRDHMLYFLENHDEQRVASDFFAANGRKGVPGLVVSALLQQNPLMIYAGQEYGERGMDKEGFSGHDGRTTIFDYWSIDTLVRAAKHKLTDEETALKDIYNKVIHIATTEKAVIEGVSFDLMYVNNDYHRQYAFLRKAGSELLLVVVNFDELPATMDVTIPSHAFDFLKIREKKAAKGVDLLSGRTLKRQLKRDEAVTVDIDPLSAVILKF